MSEFFASRERQSEKPKADRDGEGDAGKEDQAAGLEDVPRIGVIGIPPQEEFPRRVEGMPKQGEVRRAELRLVAERIRGPLCRNDGARGERAEHAEDLAPVNASGAHAFRLRSPGER